MWWNLTSNGYVQPNGKPSTSSLNLKILKPLQQEKKNGSPLSPVQTTAVLSTTHPFGISVLTELQ
jgi:hypothetical protein